jgi:hypothetical protein
MPCIVPLVVTTKGAVVELRGQLCLEVGDVDPRAIREATNAQVDVTIIAPNEGLLPAKWHAAIDFQLRTRK